MRDDNGLTGRILALNMARGCPLTDEVTATLIAHQIPMTTDATTIRAAMERAGTLTKEAHDAYGSVALAWGYANGFRLQGYDPATALDRATELMHEDLDVLKATRRHYTEPNPGESLEPTVRLAVAMSVIARHRSKKSQ